MDRHAVTMCVTVYLSRGNRLNRVLTYPFGWYVNILDQRRQKQFIRWVRTMFWLPRNWSTTANIACLQNLPNPHNRSYLNFRQKHRRNSFLKIEKGRITCRVRSHSRCTIIFDTRNFHKSVSSEYRALLQKRYFIPKLSHTRTWDTAPSLPLELCWQNHSIFVLLLLRSKHCQAISLVVEQQMERLYAASSYFVIFYIVWSRTGYRMSNNLVVWSYWCRVRGNARTDTELGLLWVTHVRHPSKMCETANWRALDSEITLSRNVHGRSRATFH